VIIATIFTATVYARVCKNIKLYLDIFLSHCIDYDVA
jgi:hypothetical protein